MRGIICILKHFDSLPVQTTTNHLRGNLAVPTIRSRLNYENIPIKFAYLMDIEDCSSEDELESHIELLSKNRMIHRRLARKIKELAAKYEKSERKEARRAVLPRRD